MNLPKYKAAQYYNISPQGMQNLLTNTKNAKYSGEDVLWTTDIRKELPIRLATEGLAAETPTTLIAVFKRAVKEYGDWSALSVKIDKNWFTYTYLQYYEECIKFAKSLIAFKLPEYTAVNIIGFNAPAWCIGYYGSLFARCLPVGIYSTNSQQACEYIAEHSEAKVVLAQNRQYVQKYLPFLQAGKIEVIVVYNDPQYRPTSNQGKILSYDAFIKAGQQIDRKWVQQRMQRAKPGECCTLVYTSGTTGMPKGVMLSHDNITWTIKSLKLVRKKKVKAHRMISYLPLSHVAAQMIDVIAPLVDGAHVYFAEPTALQGTLFQTVMEVRPTQFFAVPRIWQKVYDKLMEISRTSGWLKSKIANWAKNLGTEGTLLQQRDEQTSFEFKLAKKLVFSKIKAALGLDQCVVFSYGGGPLDPNIRKYFLSINFFLNNGYGMSQSSGPQNATDYTSLDVNGSDQAYREVGRPIPGTELIIKKANPQDQEGEICYRGRNTFMGYFKNPQETAKTIDAQGFLHSGDIGKVNKEGVLFITGRAKELIITTGGQNVPPVLLENQLRAALPFVSNFMVVGDNRKYLTCLITLKEEPLNSGKLDIPTKEYFASKGSNATTVQEAIKDGKVRQIIEEGIKKANLKAFSRAQHVQDFRILPYDFSPQNDLLTPSLKLRRTQVLKRFVAEVQSLYNKPSL